MWIWLLIPFGYLLGSLSMAIIVCKVLGLPDPRTIGSRNPGATNVLRIDSPKAKPAALITFFGDIIKGLIPILVARHLGADETLQALCGIAALIGHLYPIYFGFEGGKAIATSLGVLTGFSWYLGAIVLGTWTAVLLISRISSLAAIIAATLVPVYTMWLAPSTPFVATSFLIFSIAIWRHIDNIKRLIQGEEHRFVKKKDKN
ncbi:MAG: glycerol-3-phosphate 1-O-acyltransferase PlsY [Gammaproteobacteria bacterium]|nr:glycerol-3-phosphate 1-O-acyltransferase PlsY [Gammaproteobacteria bacterium]